MPSTIVGQFKFVNIPIDLMMHRQQSVIQVSWESIVLMGTVNGRWDKKGRYSAMSNVIVKFAESFGSTITTYVAEIGEISTDTEFGLTEGLL